MDPDEPLAHSLADYLLDVVDQLDAHAILLRRFARHLSRARLTADDIAHADGLVDAGHQMVGHYEVARLALRRLLGPLVAGLPLWRRARIAWAVLVATAPRGVGGDASTSRPVARSRDGRTPPEPRCTRP